GLKKDTGCNVQDQKKMNNILQLGGGNVILITTTERWDEKLQKQKITARWLRPTLAPLGEFSTSWKIKATPTFFVLKNGRPVGGFVGENENELVKNIEAAASGFIHTWINGVNERGKKGENGAVDSVRILSVVTQYRSMETMANDITALSLQNNQVLNRGPQLNHSRMAKIEFPKFSGDDVKGWMFRCEQFFLLEQTLDLDKTTVREYEDAFDSLLIRVEISEDHAISLFMGGLPTKIEMGVRMFKPKTLADAYCSGGYFECR
ncbi:putative mitochondrial protein, partial [Tanacetum coccineum]